MQTADAAGRDADVHCVAGNALPPGGEQDQLEQSAVVPPAVRVDVPPTLATSAVNAVAS
jgi:hypothetical protein